MSQCIHCGAPLPAAGAVFCGACGKSQQVAAAPAHKPPAAFGATQYVPQQPAALPEQPAPVSFVPGQLPNAAPPAVVAAPLAAVQGAPPATVAGAVGATLQIVEPSGTINAPLVGDAITLGRRPENNIVLHSLFVSGKHARFDTIATAHRITDVGSTNGIYFNGQRVTEQMLSDGDVIRIPDPTTANFVNITYVNPLAPRVHKAGQISQSYPTPPGKPLVTIGRVDTDIVLDSPLVSRVHAQVEWHTNHHVVRDLGATNGTFVNGQKLSGARPIKPGDVVQIGPFKLTYDGDSLDTYDQRGAIRVDARGLKREVPDPTGKGKKCILNDVWLSIEPREFVALVGGSGTGKSTLMMSLSGFLPAETGQVLVNGDDYYKNFDAYRSILGYVPQDDILHRMLPVKRALEYAARLKLPPDTDSAEIAKRVAHVLDAVDMTAHKDKLVDNLSGGQRKRVSIASELLNDPSLMFLDEPTSGLDPGLEKKMMFTLRQLADSGRTVVLVTHATANITQCDHVAFMSTGRMVYFGPPQGALPFFQVTSGDFADIYTKLEGRADPKTNLVTHDLRDEYAHWKSQNPNSTEQPFLAELWEMRYRRSAEYQKYVLDRLNAAPQGPSIEQQQESAKRKKLKPSLWRQFFILTMRYIDLTFQDRRNLLIMVLQAPIIGALLMLVSKENSIAGTGSTPWDAKKLLFMLSTVGVWFGIINAAREICKETPILKRERLANLRIGPYVASKVVVLTLLVVVQAIMLVGIVNLRVAFPENSILLGSTIEITVTVALAALAGLALGLLISALASSPDKAISVVPLALIPQILFAGLIFKLEGATNVVSWFTASRWSMDALGSVAALNDIPIPPAGRTAAQIGMAEEQYTNTVPHLLMCWGILIAYAAACIYATGYVLGRQKR